MEGEEREEREESQVIQQLAVLDSELGRLYEQISKLEERLSIALRARPEVKCAEEPKQNLVPLANLIRDSAIKVECASSSLVDIMARLEL